jgi:hypothetical protein
MDQVNPEGVTAPIETTTTTEPVATPDGAAPEKTDARPESDEPRGVAKRIKELTDARRAAEAREERLLALLEQRTQAPVPREGVEPEKGLADFNYDEKRYTEYVLKRVEANAEKAAKLAADRYRSEQDAISRRAKFDERVDAFARTVEDYHEVVTETTPVSEAMADVLLDSDDPGSLMYYLGQNPDVARKLYYLSPAKAGRELARIEDRLAGERKKAGEKPVSKAPPPTPKIEAKEPGSRIRSTDPEAEKLSGDEWARLREKELAAERKTRRS